MADRRRRLISLPAALLGVSLESCAASRPIEGPVRLGEVAAVGGPKVRPDRVIEDSRCPTDVQCVWAGRLIVRATVSGGGWSTQLDLTLGIPMPVADGMLTLVNATPKRAKARRDLPSRFTFAFQGGL